MLFRGIFEERVEQFLKPFPYGNADLLPGIFAGLEKLLEELPIYKEQLAEKYIETKNKLLRHRSKVLVALRDAEGERDDRIRRKMKTGKIETPSWL
ncbi:hypothetical protein ES702_07546 [subsurface metagenome]